MRRLLLSSALVGGLLLSRLAFSFSFTPTESEWAAWPDYCKARYVTTMFGSRSSFANRYPRSAAAVWSSRLGETTFTDVHHYCAALSSMSRARAARDPHERHSHWQFALENALYTFRQSPTTSPIFVQMAGNIATIQNEMGQPDEAIITAKSAMEAQPKDGGSYLVLALLCTLIIIPLGMLGQALPGAASTIGILQRMLEFGILFNLILVFFNLLPIPPLDGSHVVKHLLPPGLAARYERVGMYGMVVLLLLLTVGRPVLMWWMSPMGIAFASARRVLAPYILPGPWTS